MIGEFDVGLLAGASTSRSIIRWELTRIYDQLASDTPHYHIMVKACLTLSKPEEKFLQLKKSHFHNVFFEDITFLLHVI